MKIIKWVVILTLFFIASILASPLFVLACWLDREESKKWLEHIGETLKQRIIEDSNK